MKKCLAQYVAALHGTDKLGHIGQGIYILITQGRKNM